MPAPGPGRQFKPTGTGRRGSGSGSGTDPGELVPVNMRELLCLAFTGKTPGPIWKLTI